MVPGMAHWSFPNDGSLFAAYYAKDGTRYRLSVERMPDGDGRWEWMAWEGNNPRRCRHGYAPRLSAACHLAERAAAELEGIHPAALALMSMPGFAQGLTEGFGFGGGPSAAAA